MYVVPSVQLHWLCSTIERALISPWNVGSLSNAIHYSHEHAQT